MGTGLGSCILIGKWLFWAALSSTVADYTKKAHVVESDFLILYI